MKVIIGFVLGTLAIGGLVAGAAAMGIVDIPFLSVSRAVQGSPALHPLTAQTGTNADMIVTLSERYLNNQLAAGMPQGGQVSDAQLDVHENNRADINATVPINSLFTVKSKIALLFSVQNGRIVIDVQSVDVGGFGIPNSMIEPQITEIKQTTEAQLNSQLANLAATAGLKLEGMSTTENSLTLDFVQ